MGNSKTLYLKTTKDDLELPIAVADTGEELARILGVTKSNVFTSIARGHKGWHRIILDEEENIDEHDS